MHHGRDRSLANKGETGKETYRIIQVKNGEVETIFRVVISNYFLTTLSSLRYKKAINISI